MPGRRLLSGSEGAPSKGALTWHLGLQEAPRASAPLASPAPGSGRPQRTARIVANFIRVWVGGRGTRRSSRPRIRAGLAVDGALPATTPRQTPLGNGAVAVWQQRPRRRPSPPGPGAGGRGPSAPVSGAASAPGGTSSSNFPAATQPLSAGSRRRPHGKRRLPAGRRTGEGAGRGGLRLPADPQVRPLPQPRRRVSTQGPQAFLPLAGLRVCQVHPDRRAPARHGRPGGAAQAAGPGRKRGPRAAEASVFWTLGARESDVREPQSGDSPGLERPCDGDCAGTGGLEAG